MIQIKYQILLFQFLIIALLYIKSINSISINGAKLEKHVASKPNNQIRIEPNTNDKIFFEENKNETIFTSEKIPVKYWRNKKKEALQQRIENEIDYNSSSTIVVTSNKFRFYDQLNSNEKQIYDILYANSIKPEPNLEITIVISKITDIYAFIDELVISAEKIFTVLSYENPELWWIGTYQFVVLTTQSIDQYIVNFYTIPEDSTFYGYNSTDIYYINQEIESEKNKIMDNISNLNITSPYAIMRYLHDYLITNIVYTLDENKKHIRTLYGALVENECVCEGYSEAFQYLTQQYGINCIVARSSTHEWNFVEINNKWYIMDVTYDDPMINGEYTPSGLNENLRLDYFLIGTDDKVTKNSKYYEEVNHILIYSGFSDKEMVTYPNIEKTYYVPSDMELNEIFSMDLSSPSTYSNIKTMYDNNKNSYKNNEYDRTFKNTH
ncbi:hypothetical protein BCR36DRAFT_404101 [Piromyces finnis]|uniref:Transglutaminase-like domain-containing protein n=1 Tax=Piromyces finnis TaxID=1754191 RepID=A0A1Y1VBZ6_9FUNG|nr:hypothetical protein BCR36DRAFT_404101 [Piromyces finnis]|eukprot:ORX51420.1 hypothetical protein BCR36DRAFT_404101 [Piromyces finnis]